MGLNERQIKAVMYVKENGKITNMEYQKINSVSDETARVELNKMAEKGILLVKGKGRSTHYVIE